MENSKQIPKRDQDGQFVSDDARRSSQKSQQPSSSSKSWDSEKKSPK